MHSHSNIKKNFDFMRSTSFKLLSQIKENLINNGDFFFQFMISVRAAIVITTPLYVQMCLVVKC